MAEIFVISDTHFSHANILKFESPDGSLMRPFDSVEAMDELMVERWNEVVRPQDKVYHLGDVAMRKEHLSILARLNGHKRLVRGNHDIFDMKCYLPYFDDIYGTRVLDGMIFSHIPLHPASVGRFRANVHGHVHTNGNPTGARYVNVCVEHTLYRPLALYEVKRRITETPNDPNS